MTAPREPCTDLLRHSQILKQEASTLASQGNRSSIPHEHMAATSIDASWAGLQDLYQYDDGYANAMSSDQPPMAWASNPNASNVVLLNNYQIETHAEHQDTPSYSPSLSGWPSVYNAIHPSMQRSYQEPDQTRPRTIPTVDLDQVQLNGFGGSTVVPQQLHQYNIPRSDPYQYGSDDIEPYPQQSILETVEAMSPVLQQHVEYDWYPANSSTSYHSTPIEQDPNFDGDDESGDEKHEPYAKTLYRCLRDAPNHTMVLRDIYEWFKKNTSRGREPHEKGWQNSIRHNLSMNQAFEKIESTANNEPSRRGYQWRLTEQALRAGCVQSTTRFRNKQPNKRGSKSHNPAPQRQMSGRRGGVATRYSAVQRRSDRLRASRRALDSPYRYRRSHSLLNHEMSSMGHEAAMYPAVSSTPTAIAMRDGSYSGSVSPMSSPYSVYEPRYDWPPHLQPPIMSATPVSGVMEHEQYVAIFNPTSARDTPEIIWHEPGNTIFGDSSTDATPTMPATPASFDDFDVERTAVGLGIDVCHL